MEATGKAFTTAIEPCSASDVEATGNTCDRDRVLSLGGDKG